MSHNHSQSSSRAGTPSECVARDTYLGLAEGESQSLTSFHAFGYETHLNPFSLAGVPSGPRANGGSHQMYNTGAAVPQPTQFPGGGPQSVYHSPTSSPSSPNPHYGDFNGFPLSPPQSGGPLVSFINQQPHTNQPGLALTQHQPLSPMHLSSPLHQTTFDISRHSNLQSPPHSQQPRRDSYSSRPDRRHSSASATSLRSFHPSSPFSNYSQLTPSATTTQSSPLYGPSMIPEESCRPSSLYVDTNREVGPSSGGIGSASSMMSRGSAASMNMLCQNQSMGPPLPPPAKTGTRQYRKKTPPEACAVCGSNQTPEWRKGPSGLRTLCNACGLTAAKLSTSEPTTVEEVWQQLNEVGLNRFRGNFALSEEQKSIAAQNWANQATNNSNSNRNTHTSRSTLSGASLNSSQTPLKATSRITGGSHPKLIGSDRNPADMDAAHQLFSMSRGRGNSLSSISIHNPGPPPSPLGLVQSYLSPSSPHPDSLEMNERFKHMSCTTADFSGLSSSLAMTPGCSSNGLNSAHYPPSPLLSAGDQHHHHVLGLYSPALTVPSNGNPTHGRRNSIGGHRMSISSIINQDPPSRPASSINSDAHLYQLQQQQAQHMHSLLLQHPTQAGYPKPI
ncbi:hypothetical protein CROQUDRAFT_93558 [Cronartium quercuum f. sp. fusiforme G11]|uniref:GATA-type domain-containing protein n=1 Tax=Cronartium quercuum f. sp. fusiforme G11 TaxID=708437 RepID=A0A9P6NF43_9BASI|nr:hypothetical protein CROQUDRAFT_93558 [Cronartium quercuum f. sp. fusiforme G11]